MIQLIGKWWAGSVHLGKAGFVLGQSRFITVHSVL